jgi:NAD(P)-dependent dehydrogenase (short-subunit alcohol dehydrogenase family)
MFSGKLALVTGGGDGIGAMLLAGGGLVTCATEPGQLDIMRDRYAQLCASIVES